MLDFKIIILLLTLESVFNKPLLPQGLFYFCLYNIFPYICLKLTGIMKTIIKAILNVIDTWWVYAIIIGVLVCCG